MSVCAVPEGYSAGMRLLLDFGNTRLKWALTAAAPDLVQHGVVSYDPAAVARWRADLSGMASPLTGIRYASVVTDDQLAAVLQHFPGVAHEPFRVAAMADTLKNAYATPDTLGVDRWAAAIGAWQMTHRACLVVSAGTATTIDLIESLPGGNGVYRGGLILPGVDLMLQSLHQRAARLPQAVGVYRVAPDVANTTHDAMTCGALDATCGAIERMARRLPEDAPWLVTGGAAPSIAEVLGARVSVVNHLVLLGMR
jgi:type III pantothenate kinase